MDAAAALLRRDGDTLDTRGRVPVQIGQRSRDALEQEVYPGLGDSDVGRRAACKMHSGGRACAHRTPMTFLHACGPAVAAGSTLALHGRMGACAAQALAVRLPRLLLVGAASHEHVLHVRTPAAWSESIAETCGSAGSTLGSRCMSAVNSYCAPLSTHSLHLVTLLVF